MRQSIALSLLLAGLGSAARAESAAPPADLSPAQYGIVEANKLIAQKPSEYTGYNLLASALVRRAQETSDPAYYAQARDSVKRSLALSPGNFETSKIQVSVLLGQHDYPQALAAAQALNKKVPDDVMVYGLLTDAYAELGNYKDAEISAQWMLNLRPGNLPALLHAAYLRELFGELDGSYELLNMAYESTSPTENPDRASILTRMGHVRLLAGNVDEAEKLLREALKVFPDYNPALGALAQACMARKNYDEAIALLQQQYQAVPSPVTLYNLAEAHDLAGHAAEANKTFAEFLTRSAPESASKDNANRELVFYYADHAHLPSKALEVARQEYAWRKDVYTLDAYAWALHVNGRDSEARKQLDLALAVGVHDPKILRHTAQIPPSTNESRVTAPHPSDK